MHDVAAPIWLRLVLLYYRAICMHACMHMAPRMNQVMLLMLKIYILS